jgi:hypothetical protein
MCIGMLYFYTLSQGGRNNKRLIFLLLAALFGTLGVLIKPTVGILFAALLIHLFCNERFTSFIKQGALIVAVLFILDRFKRHSSSALQTDGLSLYPLDHDGP